MPIVTKAEREKIVGIDPGFNGAIAVLDGNGQLLSITDIPSYTVITPTRKPNSKAIIAKGGPKTKIVNKSKSHLDNNALFNLIPNCKKAIVEEVAAMPGQGSSSMFSFGKVYGAILMAVDNKAEESFSVKPNEWQKYFDVNMSKAEKGSCVTDCMTPSQKKSAVLKVHKTKIANKALELYPEAEIYNSRGTLKDGRADALLIARYLFEKGEK
jgi:crossover junction endodeoxyribonuclease RuvC